MNLNNGILYTVYCSEDLSDWVEVPLNAAAGGGDSGGGGFTVTGIDSDFEMVEVDLTVQETGRFFRVGVTVE